LVETLRNKGVGVLIVTHNLEMFRKVADDMIFLNKGEVMEKGNDIFQNPKSKELKNFLG